MEEAQAGGFGRQQHAREAQQRDANGVGINDRQNDQPVYGLTAEARSGNQVSHQDNAKHRDQFQDQTGKDQRHAFQQCPRRRTETARHQRVDVEGLPWSKSLGFAGLLGPPPSLTSASASQPT